MVHFKLPGLFLAMHAVSTTAFVVPSNHMAFSTRINTNHHYQKHNPVDRKRTKQNTHRYPFFASKGDEEEEWWPSDPAHTTPQLISSLWNLVGQGLGMTRGESTTVLFPQMEEKLTPDYVERLMGHFDHCKDVCDDFGVNTILVPYTVKKMGRNTVSGFTVKSFKNPNMVGTLASDGDFNFAPDPFWDDDEDWDMIAEAVKADYEEDRLEDDEEEEALPPIENRIPDDDDEIIEITKKWVDKMMSDMGICPFTSGPDKAGLPMGNVFYCTDRSTSMEAMYLKYWKEVVRVEQNPEKDLSTTLLIAPEFCIDNVELFENFSSSLTHPLESLQVEELLQLVFFHPDWTFRDGGDRSGMAVAANYARRSPWPMINILRTSQVRTAQRGIPTGLVYKQNEKTLDSIGYTNLEKMLRKRDWSDIEGMKVDRKDMEALRVAQDLQKTGKVAEEDTSFAHDSTPAANKINPEQIEGGDMVKVIKQALEKRLTGGEEGGPIALSGAETTAAMMASDFLLEHMEELKSQSPADSASEKRRKEAMKYFDEDEFVQSEVSEDDEMDILFGGGGIPMTDDDDDSSTGVDPRSFY